jgi:ubiquitin-conjugating enzyme E2 variant
MHLLTALLHVTAQTVLIIALADFVAGLIHWLEDTYFDADTPVIGPLFIRPNIVHHHLPRYFTRLTWWESSRELVLAAALLVAASRPLGFFGWQVVLFAALSANANQIHKWSHRTRRENGRIISLLQDCRILQTPRHHGLHHTDPKNTCYCPITNFVNPLLERVSFWERIETLVEKLTGIAHRDDTSNRGHGPGPDWLHAYRHPPAQPAASTSIQPKTPMKKTSVIPSGHTRQAMFTPPTRGAASILALVALVIVGWTVGLLMQGPATNPRPDPKSNEPARTQTDAVEIQPAQAASPRTNPANPGDRHLAGDPGRDHTPHHRRN